MSDNKFILRDQNDDLTICLSEPKDTDLVLFVYSGDIFDRVRVITEHGLVYYSIRSVKGIMSGDTLTLRRSCFDILDGMLNNDYIEDRQVAYYVMTYAEVKKLTPQEYQIRIQCRRAYTINEIMDQIEIRRKELLPELFG